MKTLLTLILIILSLPVWAADKEGMQINACPKTQMQRDCLQCHVVGDFRVRETAPDAGLVYPNASMRVINSVGYFYLTEIDSKGIREFFEYLDLHKIKWAVIEIHSPGGALFDGQRIVSYIQAWQAKGGKVETRLYGMAFSAGFYIFVAGDHRLVARDADLMWHELQSFEGFGAKITTPSDQEEKTRILRHLQNIRNAYLASRCKLSKAEIDNRVSKKEWWMSGADAVKFGFADGYLRGMK